MFHGKLMAGVLAGLVGSVAVSGPLGVGAAKHAGDHWVRTPLGRLVSGHIGRLIVLHSELNLTDAQKAALGEMLVSRRPDVAKAAQQVFQKRNALCDAVLADSPDEAAIRKASDDLGHAIGDAAVLASRIAAQAKPVLTDEQRQAIKKCRTQCKEATEKFLERAAKAQ